MTKRHLEIFTTVYECKSMTKAAAALFMTQPAVSQTIREMEEYYAVQLFERTPRGLLATAAAHELYSYSKNIFALFTTAEQSLRSGGQHVIRMGANRSIGAVFLPAYVNAFRVRDPAVRIFVRVSGYQTLQHLLSDNSLDFALMEDSLMDPRFVWTPYYQDKLVIVAAPDSPYVGRTISLQEMSRANFLLREKGAGVRDRFDYLMFLHNLKIEPLWESAATTALAEAAKAGLGLAVLPYLLVRRQLDRGELAAVQVAGLSLERTVHIVRLKSKVLSPAASQFAELIRAFDHSALLSAGTEEQPQVR